ncbi:PCRF domain-containing protein [Sulfurospirillum multivorans]|uniref:Disulfide isomerase n=2 Tax=Sulfurospirillum multivorans TaxID=66821 RepID=A0AA86ANI7_SULMK|nr:hypothetical protein [Sulfurospirillum multivorans]AHJ13007.1 putative disulfide isomerase [Sulfurospirillum multivorans DSM 12446]QEH06498.1 putative disulfide isomerase [Sulfurospirillum multivorans]
MKTQIHICMSIITLLSVGAFASTVEVLRDDFFQKIGTERQKALTPIVNADDDYKKAMDYLNDSAYMLKMPELNFHGQKIAGRYMPDCEKALPYFINSFSKKNNTLSAYLGLHCINNDAFMKKNADTLKQKRIFAEGLYKVEKQLCMSYITFGDVLINGVAGAPEPAKAIKVFDEAKLRCYRFASDWEKRVIDTKLEQAKYKNRLPSK